MDNSKVQRNFRVTLTRGVRSKLSIRVGSLIDFLESDRGDVVVKRAELRPA